MIIPLNGNLLDDDAEVLVCTTNATGPNGRPAMGKGIALDFSNRWPSIRASYERDCLSGVLAGGRCRLYPLPTPPRDLFSPPSPPRWWAAFCTKHNWKYGSRYAWIEQGLAELVQAMKAGNHATVAMPPLGCGNGGLSWDRVLPMIELAFQGKGIEIRTYAPRH